LVIFAALGVVLVCVSLLLSVLFGRSFKKDIYERNLRLASSIAGQVEASLNHNGVELWQLSHDILWDQLDDVAAQKLMDRTLNYHPLIEKIYLLDSIGRVVHVSPENKQLIGLDMSSQPYFIERIRDGSQIQWHDSYLSSDLGGQTVAMCVGHKEGTLVAHINLIAFREMVKSEYPISEGFISILDGNGKAIGSPDQNMDTASVDFFDLPSVRKAFGGIEGSYEERIGGVKGLSSAYLIQEMGWVVLIFQPETGAFGAVNKLLRSTIVVLLSALLAAMIISFGLLRRIMKPIENLIAQTRNLATGGYNVLVKTNYAEFEELAESFNHMARSIEAREDDLKCSESRYRELFDKNPLPVMIFNADDLNILDVSRAAVEDYGYTREEFMGMSVLDIRPEEDVSTLKNVISNRLPGRDKAGVFRHRKKDGTVFYVDVTSHEIVFLGKKAIMAICKDVTSQILVEETLKESQEKLRATLESIGDAIIILDPELNVTWTNSVANKNIGYFVDQKCFFAAHGTNEPCTDCPAIRSLKDERTYNNEEQIKGPDGLTKIYLVNTAPMYDNWGNVTGVVKSLKDITEMKRSEELLLESLAEKEILLKEVHHRVKNNLQAISGLIDMQSHFTTDLWTKKVLQDSQNRILSMSLIHEKLHSREDLNRVDFGDYVHSLVKHLARIYRAEENGIEVEVSHEKILLNAETALPCGLIITELVSNSFNHAFPENGGRTIKIHLKHKGSDQFVITIGDNGTGMENDLENLRNNSLGSKLVESYIEFLSGTFEVPEEDRTHFRITFSEYEECPIAEL
jgi:PAS domain S-box-containing protein